MEPGGGGETQEGTAAGEPPLRGSAGPRHSEGLCGAGEAGWGSSEPAGLALSSQTRKLRPGVWVRGPGHQTAMVGPVTTACHRFQKVSVKTQVHLRNSKGTPEIRPVRSCFPHLAVTCPLYYVSEGTRGGWPWPGSSETQIPVPRSLSLGPGSWEPPSA